MSRRLIFLVLLVLQSVVACHAPAPARTIPEPVRETRSNILRADYVGSAACAGCHADVYAKWARSPMRNMTRNPGDAQIRAPFAGETFSFKSDQVTLFREDGRRFVQLRSIREGSHLFQVTRLIGSRYREDFAGIEVTSADEMATRGRGPELVLPVTYYFETQGYRPKGYSVMTRERPGLHVGGVWNQTCIFCHNTVPWFDTALGQFAGRSPPSYQGVVVDRILPQGRRFGYTVTHDATFRAEVAREEAFLGIAAEPPAPDSVASARAGMRALMGSFTGQHVIEEGIGCESCHGGGREHAADPRVKTSYAPRSDFLAVGPASGGPPSRALLINRTCARCHQVLFSRYPYTWEGGFRHGGSPGGSSGTSGEARDFLLGGPGRNMPCTACHDPHARDNPDALAGLATPAGNAVCAGCHKTLAAIEGLRRHAHHDPEGPAGACIACHMPRKNMALDYRLTRYHRIGSPTDRERVEGDRPLECALCHADQSIARLVSDMERLWGKHYDGAKLRALYGDLDQNALLATLTRGRPHEQVAAAMTLADKQVTQAAPLIAGLLSSPYPLARRFAAQALSRLHPCDVDVDASVDQIRLAIANCGLGGQPTNAPDREPWEDHAHPGDED